MDEIRLLTKDDIEVRVAQTTQGQQGVRATVLLYKNARVDMKILDELYGPMGWQRAHKLIGDRLYCIVSVWDKDKQEWIYKEDVGTESNTEPEKGQASDAFKRACFNWGIGRELYTAPRTVIPLADNEYTKDQSGRIRVWATFSVGEIGYDVKSRTINRLVLVDGRGNVRYEFGEAQPEPSAEEETPSPAPAKRSRSRKTAAQADPQPEHAKEAQPEPEPEPSANYTPLERETYFKVLKAYVDGKKTKAGLSYRDAWIMNTHAGPREIQIFDDDAQKYRMARRTSENIRNN